MTSGLWRQRGLSRFRLPRFKLTRWRQRNQKAGDEAALEDVPDAACSGLAPQAAKAGPVNLRGRRSMSWCQRKGPALPAAAQIEETRRGCDLPRLPFRSIPGLLVSALRWRRGREFGYAASNESFSLASTIEPDLGRLSPTIIFAPRRGSRGRGCADQKKTSEGRQRIFHVRFESETTPFWRPSSLTRYFTLTGGRPPGRKVPDPFRGVFDHNKWK